MRTLRDASRAARECCQPEAERPNASDHAARRAVRFAFIDQERSTGSVRVRGLGGISRIARNGEDVLGMSTHPEVIVDSQLTAPPGQIGAEERWKTAIERSQAGGRPIKVIHPPSFSI